MADSVFDLIAPGRHSTTAQRQYALVNNEGGADARAASRRDRREDAVKASTPVSELIGAAQVQGGLGLIDRAMQESGMDATYDPDLRLPDDFQKDMENHGIGTDQWKLIGYATSQDTTSFSGSLPSRTRRSGGRRRSTVWRPTCSPPRPTLGFRSRRRHWRPVRGRGATGGTGYAPEGL